MWNTATISGEHGLRMVIISGPDGSEVITAWVKSDAEIRQLLREYAVTS